jgi:hypothetical protein
LHAGPAVDITLIRRPLRVLAMPQEQNEGNRCKDEQHKCRYETRFTQNERPIRQDVLVDLSPTILNHASRSAHSGWRGHIRPSHAGQRWPGERQ